MFTNFRLRMLNREAGAARPAEIIKNLDIKDSTFVADIGAGGGYFTYLFSKKVGKNGKVYAVDIKPEYLDYIKQESKKKGLDNIITVLATENKISLSKESIDLIFLRNAFHHLPEPHSEYFKKIVKFLKSDGKIVIIEHKKSTNLNFTNIFGHFTPEEVIIDTLDKCGYSVAQKFDFLPKQSFIIFKEK
jgi:arsenite methyltransferase